MLTFLVAAAIALAFLSPDGWANVALVAGGGCIVWMFRVERLLTRITDGLSTLKETRKKVEHHDKRLSRLESGASRQSWFKSMPIPELEDEASDSGDTNGGG